MIEFIKDFFSKIEHKIAMRKLEKQMVQSYDQVITDLIAESRKRYGKSYSSELCYVAEALSKAALREVHEDEYDEDDYYGEMAIITPLHNNHTCPTCHAIVYRSQNYCSYCGQRIIFSRRKIC